MKIDKLPLIIGQEIIITRNPNAGEGSEAMLTPMGRSGRIKRIDSTQSIVVELDESRSCSALMTIIDADCIAPTGQLLLALPNSQQKEPR